MTLAPSPVRPAIPPPAAAEPAHRIPALAVRGLTKRFADVVAASGLELDFFESEIHAVLGENGAGKSTLMKMLYGYYRPDDGEITVRGELQHFHSPAAARERGIGMVFQNFTVVPALTVLENIALVEKSRALRLDRASLRARIVDLSERYQLAVNPDATVRDLSMGERQRVEILKLLASDARILILDEPTSVLAPHEVDGLLEVLRKLRADGYAILLITHKMREVFACADRVSVLRRGRMVGGGTIDQFDEHSLIKLMLDERVEGSSAVVAAPGTPAAPVIQVRGVTAAVNGHTALRNVSLEVRAGELVGIAAVAGNGQAALADVLLGVADIHSGTVHLSGDDITHDSPSIRLEAGIGIIPEDPVTMGGVGTMTVRENLMLTAAEFPGKGKFALRLGLARRTAAALAEKAPFPLPALSRMLGTLSGGNVQRVVLAREINGHCKFLAAYYPSRGLDVASTRAVQQMLVDLRDSGCAVLLVSEDLEELQALCDRILVMHAGEVAGSFGRGEGDLVQIGRLMTGAHE